MFFYAGHGVQYQNEDYIIPIGANIETEDEINDEAIKVEAILEKMEEQGENRLNIVILDACRNNPFPRSFKRGIGSKGLNGIEAPIGSLIAYATGKGMEASDGNERNGLYTKHLLENIQKPGISLAEVFIRTRTGVMRDSNNKQRPWEQTAITGNFFFLPAQQNNSKLPIVALVEPTSATTTTIMLDAIPSDIGSIASDQENWTDPVTKMEFRWISAEQECFMMGSPPDELGRDSDEKQHRSCIDKGFWIGKYEVTQAQWPIMMKNNPKPSNNTSIFYKTDDFPVENISWHEAQQFIDHLNDQGTAKFRLPTEAEWEFAARAGTTTPFYTGNCITDLQANAFNQYNYNYCGAKGGKSLEATVKVGSYEPNPFGIHDMSGNVWEWTCSAYDKNYLGKEAVCASPTDNNFRVLRGGSWNYSSKYLRSAVRFRYNPDQKDHGVGFRLVRIE